MRKNTSTNNKRGFSLIELCIALGILVILTSSIAPVFIKRIQVKAGEKTALEMSVIQQAALSYFVANNAWPASITALQNAGYLNPSWVTNNPWQNAYTISSNSSAFTVSTTVPQEWTNLVARDLPTSSISGTIVGSTVPAPGSTPDESLPVGSIIMWSGSIASIPEGWQFCNGTNGTPDLRGRFVMGVNSGEDPGVTGGSTDHTHGPGSYVVPSHTHTYSGYTKGVGNVRGNLRTRYHDIREGTSGYEHYYEGATSTSENLAIIGISASATTLPPYYKLAYIMKMQ
jgi:prepilin-type N-terminal cleavage/methylation domain-containing protein